MNDNRPTKQINNLICGMDGCNRPVKEKLVLALDFSAGFCEDCAGRLISQGLAAGKESTI